ncbi:ABC transporter permease [Halalkalibacterium halodurans]|uniref:ABC transporter permease n=1 Tax=Halalkalibacterium halodurans TaxID=86665 RepID=UPI002E20FF53|nr:ABC transporter permease [Halalkalibacterium halodurans]MED4086939.1 ABC transporter permease [Halalkalibacterium halodurans]MED4107026.1 ABC transporter permease [Halalkalibacterium halodurans]MED4110102.1 ABC transporter permease [Halalkalibacterium halodurans]MED4150696.1 ABC transporter permease [Halalkalibacterium halodurans]
MTFTQLVWKMAKKNKRKYLFYFIANSFSVALIFIFCTLAFNDRLLNSEQLAEGVEQFLIIPTVALALFCLFFINLSHGIFMKQRKKEFGLFLSLGMSYQDMVKLMLLENAGIAFLSLVVGLLSGTVFSRLFFLTSMYYIEVTDISFQLQGTFYLYAIAIFSVIFILAIGKTLFITRGQKIVAIMKENRLSEQQKGSPWLGGIGGILVVASLVFLYVMAIDQYPDMDGYFLLGSTVVLFIGLYLALSQLGSFLIQMVKRNPSIYYRNLLHLSNLNYKFKQLTSIFFLLIVMTMVTILYSSFVLYSVTTAEQQAIERYPYDIGFVQTDTKNNVSLEDIQQIFHTDQHKITTHHQVEFFDYIMPHPTYGFDERFTFMPTEAFNQISSQSTELREGTYLLVLNHDFGEDPFPDHDLFSLARADVQTGQFMNWLNYFDGNFIVVHEKDYERIKKTFDVNLGQLHLINVSDWKNMVEAVQTFKKELATRNEQSTLGSVAYTEQEMYIPSIKWKIIYTIYKVLACYCFL